MRKPDGPTIFLGTSVTLVVIVGLYLGLFYQNGHARDEDKKVAKSPPGIPFDGDQAYRYLRQICEIGPRPTGSDGMRRQQKMLEEHFTRLGAKVSRQTFEVRHPETGNPVPVVNLIVEFHPDRADRVLLCCHYDTRPFPDRDKYRPKGVFVGANDGASGVALLMELGKQAAKIPTRAGVDFVFFDAEEFVFDAQRDDDYYFVGSNFFARTYAEQPPPFRYRWGVLLDMVADAHLDLYQERNSLNFARPLVKEIWDTAARLRVEEFIARPKHDLRDDHLGLNQIAHIPTCDIIDFDYPRPGARQSYWHTEEDVPNKCSPASLAKVGWVISEWLKGK